MSEKDISQLIININEDINLYSYENAKNYLIFLENLWKIIPKEKRSYKKPPLGYRNTTRFHQKKVKGDFEKILIIFSKNNLNDATFSLIRKVLSMNNNMNLQSIFCNLNSVHSIASNNKFDFRLYKGKEEMEYFIKGIDNFKLNQIEVVTEKSKKMSLAS